VLVLHCESACYNPIQGWASLGWATGMNIPEFWDGHFLRSPPNGRGKSWLRDCASRLGVAAGQAAATVPTNVCVKCCISVRLYC